MKNRLKRLRAIKGCTQAELATQLGVFRQTIIAMEKVSSTRACRWPLKQPGYLNCRSKKYSTIKIQIRGEYGRSGVVLIQNQTFFVWPDAAQQVGVALYSFQNRAVKPPASELAQTSNALFVPHRFGFDSELSHRRALKWPRTPLIAQC